MTPPIVCGVDRSDPSRAAADIAAALARRLGRPLLLVHAASWPCVDPQTRRTALGLQGATSDARRRSERWLDAFASELAVARVQSRVEFGLPADWIAVTAAECSAELLVVGCRGVGTLRSVALGSVSADLLRCAPCPVVVVGAQAAGARRDPLDGERLVCGVRALKDVAVARLAARLAAALALRLTLVHVAPAGERPRRLLPAVLAGIDAVPGDVELHVARGDAGEQLSALAASEQTALLVVGSRGRGPLRSGLLGSVSRHLASTAGCPVVICQNGGYRSAPVDRVPQWGSPASASSLAIERAPHQ